MEKFYEKLILVGLNISYALYILTIFGISIIAPQHIEILNSYLKTFLKVYIGLLLVIFYNPITYKKRNFTNFDRELVFSAGIILIISSSLLNGMENYVKSRGINILNMNQFD